MDLLKQFYTSIRPWGYWGPVYRQCRRDRAEFRPNEGFWWDAFNIFVGMVWQIAMVAMLMYLIIQQHASMFICLGVFVLTSTILKFTWYDRLGPGEMYLTSTDGTGNQRSRSS
jgi:hypothetical protein